MNVLSLFDGISAGRLALQRAEIKIDNYYASEIDKYAISITQRNFPDTIQIGDVREVKGRNLPKIDLLIGGSPCTGFSNAGKGLNFNDPQSSLFFEYVRLLEECKPTYFLLENVVMKKEWQNTISSFLGVNPILIDSALLSGQTRKRLYWTNIPNITQPEDKHILLQDILENGVVDRDKSYCITATYFNAGYLPNYFEKHQRQLVFNKYSAYSVREIGRKLIPDGKLRDDIVEEDLIIRKLTPLECERLQTFTENYTEFGINSLGKTVKISNTQRYKSLGNSWTVDIIAWILGFMKKGKIK